MKKLFSLCIASVVAAVSAVDVESFRNPGMEFRPETWFHLIGGNVDLGVAGGAGHRGHLGLWEEDSMRKCLWTTQHNALPRVSTQ